MKKAIKIILGVIGITLVVLLVLVVVNYVQHNLVASTGSNGNYEMAYDSANSTGLSAGSGGFLSKTMNVSNQVRHESAQEDNGDVEAVIEDRMIIKTGSLEMVVEDVSVSIEKIAEYTGNIDGFVVSSNMYKRNSIPYGQITVRIPVEKFSASVDTLKQLGEIKSERVDGQDVTEEYVDMDAQVRNYRATEEQFLNIMKKATRIEDILNVQRELGNVRRSIERIEGRMKYLTKSASMSTLTIDLSTDPSVLPTIEKSNKWKPIVVLKTSARALVEVGKLIANFAIFLVVFIPVWIVVGLVIWLGIRIYQRNKHIKNPKEPQVNFRG